MKRKLDLGIFLLAAMAASACGGGDDGGGGDGKDPPALGGDFGRYVEGVCSQLAACGGALADESEFLCGGGLELLLCGSGLEDAELPSVDACLEAVKALSCDAIAGGANLPDVCANIEDEFAVARGHTVGQVGEGCNVSEGKGGQVCAHDAYCDGDDGQCGTCVALKPNGQSCFTGNECLSDHCASDDTCQDTKPDGAACEESWDCADECIDGKCGSAEEPVIVGRACDDENPCSEGEGDDRYRCVEGTCAGKLPEGAACTDDEECDIGCDDGKCIATASCGEGDVGDHCYALFADGQCKPGLACDWDSGTCKERIAVNAACTGDVACVEGAHCTDFEENELGEYEGTCKKLLESGESCQDGSDCLSETCDTGVCVDADYCTETTQKSGGTSSSWRATLREHSQKSALKSLPKIARNAAQLVRLLP
jgi:hypothetical protein